MLAYHHSPLVRSSQPVEPWGAGGSQMPGSGFGRLPWGEKGPEKVVGVISTCLANFVDAYPASLRGPEAAGRSRSPGRTSRAALLQVLPQVGTSSVFLKIHSSFLVLPSGLTCI